MKKRIVGIELLRIVAMLMVVTLHYLSKGELLGSLTLTLTGNSYFAWFIESFAIVAVNVYVLISGYLLIDSSCKVKRVVELICQVLFYSIGISVILVVFGYITLGEVTIYNMLQAFFPIQMKYYWFVTAYIIMYIFAPVLSAAVKNMSRVQLRNVILLLLFIFSVSKSILPVKLELDTLGYDAMWFLCLFLIASYIKLYGIPILEKRRNAVICYISCSCLIFAITMGLQKVFLSTGRLGDFINAAYGYNHILVVISAVSLFYIFYKLEISNQRWMGKAICKIAPYTLGVYLFHEQIYLRTVWPKWFGVTVQESLPKLLLRAIIAILTIFVVGIIIDYIRGCIFSVFKRIGVKFDKKKEI